MFDGSFIIRSLEDYPYEKKICKVCKTDLDYYRKTGRLGCSHCYETFREELLPSIKNYHGEISHIGKFSSSYKGSDKYKIKSLNEKLKEAINKEDYIEAARLRDLIREIEGKS